MVILSRSTVTSMEVKRTLRTNLHSHIALERVNGYVGYAKQDPGSTHKSPIPVLRQDVGYGKLFAANT